MAMIISFDSVSPNFGAEPEENIQQKEETKSIMMLIGLFFILVVY